MTPKELVVKALNGEKTERITAGFHGWGLYKFALMGILSDYSREKEAWKIHGEELAKIDINFQETFQPDFMLLSEAFFESKKAIVHDSRFSGLLEAVRNLNSKQAIDEYLDLMYNNPDEPGKDKKFAHVVILSERYGGSVFIILVTEGPLHDMLDEDGVLGFERGMIAMLEKPDMFTYLAEGMYARQIGFVRALKEHGAHGYAQSESYVTADLLSPDMYRNLIFPLQRDFYCEVERIGLIPVMAFWGNVMPLLDYIKETGIRGFMCDESRKNYILDIGEIKQRLGNCIGVFGNVSGEKTLLHGTVDDVRREVCLQIEKAGRNGGFISSCGPPLSFGTPVENVKALITTAKEYRL